MFAKSLVTTAVIALTASSALADAGFVLSSPDLEAGQVIPADYYWNNFGCKGQNLRPELIWSGAPEGTKSYAVTFYDKDAPTGSGFWHWSIHDIPAEASGLNADLPETAIENNTDLNQPGFFGPCPPVGRTHTYTYTVYALSTETLELPKNASAALAGFFYHKNALATATFDVIAGPRSE